jgi:phospholipase/lecithinase/hemolysin
MKNIMLLSLWLALFLLRPSFGSEKIFVFGDSLSDTGNSFAITQLIQPTQPAPLPPPPYGNSFDKTGSITGYFPGRFTDGQNWVDYFPGVAASLASILQRRLLLTVREILMITQRTLPLADQHLEISMF